jgi:two-component system chemotaxis response regulator CheB
MSAEYVLDRPGHLTCPECGGALTKIEGDPIPKYACHIGHLLTGEAMLEAQAARIEYFLEAALALLNERGELCRQLLDDDLQETSRLEALLEESTSAAEMLRNFLNKSEALERQQ